MSEFGGLWKDANNQNALVPPKTAAQVAEELKTVTYATPHMEERRHFYYYFLFFGMARFTDCIFLGEFVGVV